MSAGAPNHRGHKQDPIFAAAALLGQSNPDVPVSAPTVRREQKSTTPSPTSLPAIITIWPHYGRMKTA